MPLPVTCPHCSQPLTMHEELLGREFVCPHCSRVMVVPVPAAVPVPAPSASLDFRRAGEEPAERRNTPYDTEVPGERIERLLPEWRLALSGLSLARESVLMFIPICSLHLAATMLGFGSLRFLKESFPVAVVVLMSLQIAVMFLHTLGQLRCGHLPPVAGATAIRRSSWCLMGVMLAAAVNVLVRTLLPEGADVTTLTLAVVSAVGTGLLLAAFLTEVTFLRRLGDHFGARELSSRLSAFVAWFWVAFWAHVVLALFEAASGDMNSRVGSCFGVVAGGISVLTLANYAQLLRLTCTAVARRAPIRLDAAH